MWQRLSPRKNRDTARDMQRAIEMQHTLQQQHIYEVYRQNERMVLSCFR